MTITGGFNMKHDSLNNAIEKLLSFSKNSDLTSTISKIEKDLSNKDNKYIGTYLTENELKDRKSVV